MAIVGLSTTAVGILLLHFISIDTPVYLLIIYLCIIGGGFGLSMPIFSLTVQNAVPLRELGVALASSQLFRNLGNTIGIGILGSIMSTKMASRMAEMFAGGQMADQSQLPPEQTKQFSALMNPETLMDQPQIEQIMDQMPKETLPFAKEMVENIRDAFSDALITTFLAGAIIMLIAVIVAVFIRAIPLVSEKDYEQQSQKSE